MINYNHNTQEGLMEWRRQPNGKLKLFIKDVGSTTFKPFQQSIMFTSVPLDKSSHTFFQPGFRTAQMALKNGYKYTNQQD